MAGKMLCKSEYALRLHTLKICNGLLCHFLRVLTERPPAYNRVCRIVIDINHGSQVSIQPHPLQLTGNLNAHFMYQDIILNSSQSHLIGKRNRTRQTHAQPPLAVDRGKQRHLRQRIQKIVHLYQTLRSGLEKQYPARLVLCD